MAVQEQMTQAELNNALHFAIRDNDPEQGMVEGQTSLPFLAAGTLFTAQVHLVALRLWSC